jgi:hypothetical protein
MIIPQIAAFLQLRRCSMMAFMDNDRGKRLSIAGLVALLVMAGLLVAAIVYAVRVWQAMAGVTMSGWGWLFMGLGVVVTIGLGAGLMALLFYSSRHDYDR